MTHKILPAVVILTVACQAQDPRSFSITAPSGSLYSDAQMENSDCADHPGSILLNFSNVGLRRLDFYFTSSPSVICLSFEGNEIDQVSPSSFHHMPNLLYLSFARNRLNFANFSQLDGHPNLHTLVLDQNKDAQLTEGPILQLEHEFRRLLYLYARDCGFRDVASLAFAPRLMHLHLASNYLAESSLKFLEDVAQHLRILDLSDNGLNRFDAGQLQFLSELHLNGNRFERLCATLDCDSGSVLALAGMKSLGHLSLARNQIASIEPSAFNDVAQSLTYLDLSDNRIQSIEGGVLQKMIYLRNLSLEGNLLTEIPDIHTLQQLQRLSLASNNLEIVKNESFSENVRLEVLDLSNNSIASVENGAFAGQLHFLESLDLSKNKLTKLRPAYMYNLRVLYVNDNLLTTLDNLFLGNFRRNSKLREVYLQNNRITKIHSHSFNYHFYNRIPDIAFIFFDAANSTVQPKNAEECKCDCSSNDIDSLNLRW